MHGELALKGDRITGLRTTLLSDNGAFFADAQPTKLRAGLFHIVTGSYDIPAAHVVADGAYTNKAPGGVAYRCSFRVTEASYLIERLVDNGGARARGRPGRVPRSRTSSSRSSSRTSRPPGFVYDSGDYGKAMRPRAREARLRGAPARSRRRRARRAGCSASASRPSRRWSAPGHGKDYDIAGLRMFDSAELRVHPTGKAILKLGVSQPGPGPRDDVRPDRRRGARHPATRTSRSRRATRTTRPTASARTRAARRRSPAPRRP